MSKVFSEHLAALVPAKGADEQAWTKAIEQIADLVLRRTTWRIAGKPHRFTEVEFYVTTANHDDPFTHGDEMQREFARWYHHRTGGEYRGGTYKGLDLAFGRDDTYAGMLIRGVESTEPPAKLLDGPCVCVDHLLSLVKHGSVPSFVDSYDRAVDGKDSAPSYLEVGDESALPLYRSARVGLSLKRGASERRVRFIAAPYRFLTEPSRIKKGRVQLVCAMHARGESAATIASVTGTRQTQVQKYIDQFELGREKEPKDYRGDLGTDELCQLFGACAKHSI